MNKPKIIWEQLVKLCLVRRENWAKLKRQLNINIDDTLTSLKLQGNSESTTQKGRSRQSKNKFSHCLLTEFTNTQDHEKSESQRSSQSLDQVNYGTQPEERRESYEDYDWEQDLTIRYSRNDDEINCL